MASADTPPLRFEPDEAGVYPERLVKLQAWRVAGGERQRSLELEYADAVSSVPNAIEPCEFDMREDGTLEAWITVDPDFPRHPRFESLIAKPLEVTIRARTKPDAKAKTEGLEIDGSFLVQIHSALGVEFTQPQDGLADLRDGAGEIEVNLRVSRTNGDPASGVSIRPLISGDEPSTLPGGFHPDEVTTDADGSAHFTYRLDGQVALDGGRAPSVTFHVIRFDPEGGGGPDGTSLGLLTLRAAPPLRVVIEKFGLDRAAGEEEERVEYPLDLLAGGTLLIRPSAVLQVAGHRLESKDPVRHARVRVTVGGDAGETVDWDDVQKGYPFTFPAPAGNGGATQFVPTSPGASHEYPVRMDLKGGDGLERAVTSLFEAADTLERDVLQRPFTAKADAFLQALVDHYAEETEDTLEASAQAQGECLLRVTTFLRHAVRTFEGIETTLVLHARSYESFLQNWISFGVEMFLGKFLDASVSLGKSSAGAWKAAGTKAKEAFSTKGTMAALKAGGGEMGVRVAKGSKELATDLVASAEKIRKGAVLRITEALAEQKRQLAEEITRQEADAARKLKAASDASEEAAARNKAAVDELDAATKATKQRKLGSDHLETLRTKLKDAEVRKAKAAAEVEALRVELEAKQAKLEKLREESGPLKTELDELGMSRQTSRDRLEAIAVQKKPVAQEIEGLEAEIVAAAEKQEQAAGRVGKAQEVMDDNATKRADTVDRQAKKKSSLEGELEPRVRELDAAERGLAEQVQEAEASAGRVTADMERLEAELGKVQEAARAQLEGVAEGRAKTPPQDTRALQALDDHERSVTDALREQEGPIEQALEKARRAQSDAMALKERLEAERAQVGGQRTAAEQAVAAAREEVKALGEEAKDFASMRGDLEADLKSRRAELETEDAAVGDLRREQDGHKTILDGLEEEAQGLQAGLDDTKPRYDELSNQHTAQGAEVSELDMATQEVGRRLEQRKTRDLEPAAAEVEDLAGRVEAQSAAVAEEAIEALPDLRPLRVARDQARLEFRQKVKEWAAQAVEDAETQAHIAEMKAAQRGIDGAVETIDGVQRQVEDGVGGEHLAGLKEELREGAEQLQGELGQMVHKERVHAADVLDREYQRVHDWCRRLDLHLTGEWKEIQADLAMLRARSATLRDLESAKVAVDRALASGIPKDMAESSAKDVIGGDARELKKMSADAKRFAKVKYAEDWSYYLMQALDAAAWFVGGLVSVVLTAGYWSLQVITLGTFGILLDGAKWILAKVLALVFEIWFAAVRGVAHWARTRWLAGPSYEHPEAQVSRARGILSRRARLPARFYFDPERAGLEQLLAVVDNPSAHFTSIAFKNSNQQALLQRFGPIYDGYYEEQKQHVRSGLERLCSTALAPEQWARTDWPGRSDVAPDLVTLLKEADQYGQAFDAVRDGRFSSSGVRVVRKLFSGDFTYQDLDQVADWIVFLAANACRLFGMLVGFGAIGVSGGLSLAWTAGAIITADVIDKIGAFLRAAVISLLVHGRVIGIQEDLLYTTALEFDGRFPPAAAKQGGN